MPGPIQALPTQLPTQLPQKKVSTHTHRKATKQNNTSPTTRQTPEIITKHHLFQFQQLPSAYLAAK
jgi:hypothetical protein